MSIFKLLDEVVAGMLTNFRLLLITYFQGWLVVSLAYFYKIHFSQMVQVVFYTAWFKLLTETNQLNRFGDRWCAHMYVRSIWICINVYIDICMCMHLSTY